MPKLGKETAAAVEANEGFKNIPPGTVVTVALKAVETGEGDKGPYWQWIFRVPEDQDEFVGRELRETTSLSTDAQWRLKQVFESFAVPTDTDTDDLIGKRVRLIVGERTIQKGERTGELVNTVVKTLPLDDADQTPATGSSGKKDSALF